MERKPFWRNESWVLVLAGLAWLGSTHDAGWLAFAVAAVPGSLLLASGVANGLWSGDPRALQHAAIGSVLGIVLGLVSFAWAGFWGGLFLIALSGLALLATGALGTQAMEPVEGVPAPRLDPRLAAEVAADESILWLIVNTAERQQRYPHRAEIERALELFEDRGWLEKAEDYHVAPPPLESVQRMTHRFRGVEYEQLSCESGFEPRPEEPGRERYLAYASNRSSHAWLLRQQAEDRPWLICIHGLGMGWPLADFTAFPPSTFQRRLGLNVLYPILPFHGPRRVTHMSGEGLFTRNVLDTVHGCAQIVWDLRRWVSWIRAQGGTRIGVYGLSLGGFSTSMLASFEEDLACAIPGIPAADHGWLIHHHTAPVLMRQIERVANIEFSQIRKLLHVATPLALTPKVRKEGRYIFGGTADRIVPPDPVHRLWLHWEKPRMVWVNAAHLFAPLHSEVKQLLRDALQESGLTA